MTLPGLATSTMMVDESPSDDLTLGSRSMWRGRGEDLQSAARG